MRDERETTSLLRKRLRWIATTNPDDLGKVPPWLAALIAAYVAMDVDDEDADAIGAIIDRIEKRVGIDCEEAFDLVCQGWRQ